MVDPRIRTVGAAKLELQTSNLRGFGMWPTAVQ